MDVVFVLDVSISIKNEANFQLMKNVTKSTFQMLNITENCSRVAMMLFARHAWFNFTLTDYYNKTSVSKAVDQIRYDEIPKRNRTGTNTPEALNLLLGASENGTLGLRNDTVHIAVFITDGRPNIKHLRIPNDKAIEDTMAAANGLRESKIYDHVYAVGIEGNKPIGKILEYIAYPSSLVFPIAGFNASLFEELGRNLTSQFCDRK